MTISHLIDAAVCMVSAQFRMSQEDWAKLLKQKRRQGLIERANYLMADAERHGFVLTIERKPLLPLAMRHHEAVVEVRDKLVRDTD